MSDSVKIDTKYCTITLEVDYTGDFPICMAIVAMAADNSKNKLAVAFSNLMDVRLMNRVKMVMKPYIKNLDQDVYLEDGYLFVIIKEDMKHRAPKLIGMVKSVEAEFDAQIENSEA